jgi:4-amino-4-deoxychorismate lyase
MCRFFETLYVKENQIRNLEYHNLRLNRTIEENFDIKSMIDLGKYVCLESQKAHRVKVIYEKDIEKIEIYPLIKRKFHSFKLIESDIEYRYKYLDRSKLNKLYQQRSNCDDIIITNNGFIKESSIANIAIFNGKDWLTPKEPLLKGTMREALIKKQIIKESDVKIQDIKSAQKIALINAIIGFLEIESYTLKE